MIDVEKLLAPISDESPTGVDLRYTDGDLTFSQIGENRSAEDPALAIEGDAKTANWPAVARQCEEALANKSKDLELVAFLAEALAHTQGFPGVRDGLRLAKEMIQAHWERLHPGFEDGEIILPIRAKPLAWLATVHPPGLDSPRCFLRAIKAIPITAQSGDRALSWNDYEMSALVDQAATHANKSHYEELSAAGAVGGEAWKLALANTPVDQLQSTLTGVNECAAELEELTKVCNERFGLDEAPPLTSVADLFGELRDTLQKTTGTGEEAVAQEGGAAPKVEGPISGRQQALQQLGQVAAFFRQSEPHSPISYLIQRAVRWGHMPLDELLREVVKNADALDHIWETLGIKPQEGGKD